MHRLKFGVSKSRWWLGLMWRWGAGSGPGRWPGRCSDYL